MLFYINKNTHTSTVKFHSVPFSSFSPPACPWKAPLQLLTLAIDIVFWKQKGKHFQLEPAT